MKRVNLTFKLWISVDNEPVVGPGGLAILEAIEKHGSIAKASKSIGMSYRFIWGYLRRVEDLLGLKIAIKKRGGVKGGGTMLTHEGKLIVSFYKRANQELKTICENLSEELNLKLKGELNVT